MSYTRAEYLINQLISNRLAEAELEELLRGIGQEEERKYFTDLLKKYFDQLVQSEAPGLADRMELFLKSLPAEADPQTREKLLRHVWQWKVLSLGWIVWAGTWAWATDPVVEASSIVLWPHHL
jgi:hypothetical protein